MDLICIRFDNYMDNFKCIFDTIEIQQQKWECKPTLFCIRFAAPKLILSVIISQEKKTTTKNTWKKENFNEFEENQHKKKITSHKDTMNLK